LVTVTFDGQLRYRRAPGFVGPSPLFEVMLHWNQKSTPHFLALLDSGSTTTIFKAELADALGITDLDRFPAIRIQTGGGPLVAHLVDLELEIVMEDPNLFACQVAFAHIPRHILGRDIVFSKYVLAFDERAQLIYYRGSQG
jgi:hypothetical protein